MGRGSYKEIELDLGALCIIVNNLPLELRHSNIILDIKLLAKLGTIATNQNTPMIQFNWQESKVSDKYRYPQIQKEEIEKLVSDMSQFGIIQPSLSPFFKLVLLVKKDESWRFLADYRTLNKEIVADKYLTAVI